MPDRKLATNATKEYVIVYLRKKHSIRNTPTKVSRGRKTFTAVSVFCYIMAKDFSRKFYKTKAWKRTREAYYKQSGGLCEICLSQGKIVPGEIVHHKVELTPNNINNPAVTLSFDNLQLVCRECHAKLHENRRRYYIDDNGNCITKY